MWFLFTKFIRTLFTIPILFRVRPHYVYCVLNTFFEKRSSNVLYVEVHTLACTFVSASHAHSVQFRSRPRKCTIALSASIRSLSNTYRALVSFFFVYISCFHSSPFFIAPSLKHSLSSRVEF